MFEPVDRRVDFARQEEAILRFWDEADIFARSLAQREDAPRFVFYDGPPFATGLPHYGHLLAGTIKDIVPRYQTMRGRYVERRFGWDCHGLPIEALAQEALGLAGAGAVLEAGVARFNETCRSMVLRYVGEWERTVRRMGRWVDFERDYKTMDPSFMETVWWVFKQLWDQGRIYRSYRIMPYSWKLNTPLSNFEAGSNYREVQDPSITVRLRLRELPPGVADGAPVHALVWTTTPWTLPGNLALCAGPDIRYVVVRDLDDGRRYLLAEARLAATYREGVRYEIEAALDGRDLEGLGYEPLFPFYREQPGAFRILVDPFVSTEDGTGLVHMAPAYGEDDFRVCRAAGIDLVDPLDADCRFTDAVPEWAGRFCKDADRDIVRRLKADGALVYQATLVHSYPYCERTDTPLIYRAIEAWYVRVEDLRARMRTLNAGVRWVPGHVGQRRFDNWLAEAKDWNVSRNRFWGSCIPVWVAEDGSDAICVGSVAELEALSGQRVTDLHKHVVDAIVFERDGKRYRRTPEVLDCWFESGAMPYAQQHYPFKRADELDRFFPADFIAEGLDQTRGWFYTLLILSTALFDRSAYRHVVVNGLVLAEDGRKMSKRLQNYPDPAKILDTYGADALRLYLIHSPVVRAEDLCFSEDGVRHALRHLLIPVWNAYSFLATYARVDGWTPGGGAGDPHLLDRWILSALDRLTAEVSGAMDAYELQQAVRPLVAFMEDLTNWYIRRSRRRFWKSTDDADKAAAYATLYEVLLRFCRIAAPFVPFLAEAIYRNLRTPDLPDSVHLCDFPEADGARRDPALEAAMADVQRVVALGRQLRVQFDLKVRQPLAGMHVVCADADRLAAVRGLRDLVADELNVKELWFSREPEGLAHLRAKPNYRVLGPRLGPAIRRAAEVIGNLDAEQLARIMAGDTITLQVGDRAVDLDAGSVQIERIPKEGLAVAADDPFVAGLEIEITPELAREGLARELVNRIQNLRKAADLDVSDRIRLHCAAGPELRRAIEEHRATVEGETLCVELTLSAEHAGDADGEVADINGHPCRLRLERATR